MKVARTAVAYAVGVVVLGWLLLGCSASAREKTITASFTAANAARDAFVAYDIAHQKSLLDAAPDEAHWKDSIREYRGKRERIVDLFAGVYRTIAAAVLIENDPKSLDAITEASKLLYAALHEFSGGSI